MFVRPDNWSKLTPAERRQARFASWMSTEGREFSSPAAKETYKSHTQRVADIIALKEPDQVPILPFIGGYTGAWGGLTPYEVMYDYDKFVANYHKFVAEFELEYNMFSGSFNPGRIFDILDYKAYLWPGHGVPKERNFQVVEEEFMRADEYDELIADPEAFYLRRYMPRVYKSLFGLSFLPPVWATMEMPLAPAFLVPLGLPEGQKALQALLDAGKEALMWATALEQAEGGALKDQGLPRLPGGMTKAPFDWLGDTLRGTAGIMFDMFRQPQKLITALDRLVPIAIRLGVETASAVDNPFVFIPLHKGADDFMSDKNFRKFYWPSHRLVTQGLIDEGLVPFQFVEGIYNSRLDIIADSGFPAGSCYWNFDQIDMAEAKKKIGSWSAIGGNVSGAVLYAGTPQQVEDEVKRLIDTCGAGGGYAMATALVLDHTTPANLKAMVNTTKSYGKYKK
jgi:hypothetical protein